MKTLKSQIYETVFFFVNLFEVLAQVIELET